MTRGMCAAVSFIPPELIARGLIVTSGGDCRWNLIRPVDCAKMFDARRLLQFPQAWLNLFRL